MKICLFSHLAFTDSEFPLVREYIKEGIDIAYYIQIYPYSLKGGLINIKEQYPHNGIFPAKIYPEFLLYRDYINLDKVFVINCTQKSSLHPYTIWTYLKFIRRVHKEKYTIVHISWPLQRIRMLLYLFAKRLVLTLHDPFPHSDKSNMEFELCRKISTKFIDKIIMLNSRDVKKFSDYYKYPQNKIYINKMGDFNYLRMIKQTNPSIEHSYILFFGYISPYKGVEYLMAAMDKVHEAFPNIMLVIAGGGELYMDKMLYANKDYIVINNKYVDIPTLIGLLKKCLFVVCPYKDATQSGVIQTAFSLSVPVVATNVGAMSMVIDDNITGRLVPPCSVNHLSDAIINLLENPKLLQQYRDNIKNKWSNEMGWEQIVKKYLEIYES